MTKKPIKQRERNNLLAGIPYDKKSRFKDNNSQSKSYKKIFRGEKMKKTNLDEEEKKLLASYDKGEWKSIENPEREIEKLALYAKKHCEKIRE